ncbi:MAG: cysteine dioxygenase [Rhodospirillaceae bacterium]|nr:cysteine dioxygenase [Rhodospirillaceae bacterium]|tara:strand:+ start:18688 stop:19293 length:606 start_codon:yes stop_codon:yes gene_type:complete
MSDIAPLRDFVAGMTRLIDSGGVEHVLLNDGQTLLEELIVDDGWLPDACAAPDPDRYSQYLLWCDPFERFSVVSFVWGPGQTTPIHDHTVWGLIGMLRGSEIGENFSLDQEGKLEKTDEEVLKPGLVSAVSPTIGDIHKVSNALNDQPSISIHVYGANIGAVRRHVFDSGTGTQKDFISGYSNDAVPNLFDRSSEKQSGDA